MAGEQGVPGRSADDPAITVVRLHVGDEAGPFRTADEIISDDFDELQLWLGLTRRTYDNVMAWNARWSQTKSRRDPQLERERQLLVVKLRAEVHEGITVE